MRLAFESILANAAGLISAQYWFDLTVFTTNCTVCSKELCTAVLVLDTVSRPERMPLAPTQLERARVTDQATENFEKEQARSRACCGLRYKRIKEVLKFLRSTRKLSDETEVAVYLSCGKARVEPFPSMKISGETVVVQTIYETKIFRSSYVKPLINPKADATETIRPR